MPDFKATVVCCTHRTVQVQSLACLWTLRDCPNPKIDVQFQDQDALISRSRSVRATKFLKSDSDVLMFLDDDVTISNMDASKLLWLATKYDIVGGAYPTKSKEKPSMAIRPLTKDPIKFGVGGGLYEMYDVSTGCVAINRKVFEKMVETGTTRLATHGARQYYPFFQHKAEDVERYGEKIYEDLSEDWYFNEKARSLGFKIWCDTTIRVGHIGNYEYTWSDLVNSPRKEYDSVNFNVKEVKVPSFAESLARAFKSGVKAEALRA